MQLRIHAQGISLTEAIRRQAHELLDLALDRLEHEVVRINVFLVDTNGPLLGGVDKSCRIVVLMRQQEPLVAEDIGESVDAVLDRVTDHLGVAACQRADSSKKLRKSYHRYVDSDDILEFQWLPNVR